MNDVDDDKLWSILDNIKETHDDTLDTIKHKNMSGPYYCTECRIETYEGTCTQCGLIISNDIVYSNYCYE